METKSSCGILEEVRIKLGFYGCFTVKPIRRSGGLAMLWKEELSLEVVNFSNHHIHVKVRAEGCELDIYFTGFYGAPMTSNQDHSWALLTSLKRELDPWCVLGDFNKIFVQDEKLGGQLRP